MEVMRTADILVVLGEVSREAELFGQLVPVAFEDGLDVLQSIEPGPGGDAAGGIEAGGRVLLAQVQQTQTDLVGLLGVIPALKLAADPQQRIWADIRRPALEAPGRPLLLSPVARWHVGRVGGKAWPVLARVRGDEAEALGARIASDLRNDEEAMERGEFAAALAEEFRAAHVIADVTTTLTRLVARTGGANLDKARQRYNDLVAASRADGNIAGELRGLHNLAFVLYNAGELDDAEQTFRAAMTRAEKTGRPWAPYGFDGRVFAAIICYVRGRWDEALELWDVGPDAPTLAAGNQAETK